MKEANKAAAIIIMKECVIIRTLKGNYRYLVCTLGETDLTTDLVPSAIDPGSELYKFVLYLLQTVARY